jgi:hypothetical protein
VSYLTSYATRNPRVRGAGVDEKLRLNLSGFHGDLNSQAARENSLYKIDTLLGALERFRAALDAEGELYAHREQHRH